MEKKVGSLCGKKWDSSKIYYLHTFFWENLVDYAVAAAMGSTVK